MREHTFPFYSVAHINNCSELPNCSIVLRKIIRERETEKDRQKRKMFCHQSPKLRIACRLHSNFNIRLQNEKSEKSCLKIPKWYFLLYSMLGILRWIVWEQQILLDNWLIYWNVLPSCSLPHLLFLMFCSSFFHWRKHNLFFYSYSHIYRKDLGLAASDLSNLPSFNTIRRKEKFLIRITKHNMELNKGDL